METGRDNSISLIRLVAMCFIIACHIFQYFDNVLAWWFNVGVQIFLFMSGYLYGTKKINKPLSFYRKNFQKILVSYCVVVIPVLLVEFFALKLFEIKELFLALVLVRVPGGAHLWFVPVILLCYLITPFLYFFFRDENEEKRSFWIKCAIIFMLIVALSFVANGIAWLFCYFMGFAVRKLVKYYNLTAYITAAVAFVLNFIQILLEYILKSDFKGLTLITNYAHIALGALLFFVMKSLFSGIGESKILKLSDAFSYEVYLVHHFFILGPLSLMAVTDFVPLNTLIVFAAIAVGAFCAKYAANFLNRIINKTINKMFGHKQIADIKSDEPQT